MDWLVHSCATFRSRPIGSFINHHEERNTMSIISQQAGELRTGSDTKLPSEATLVFASERAELDPVEPEFNVTVGEPLPESELLRIDGTSTFIIPSTTVVEADR